MNKSDQYPDDLLQRLRLLDILEKISRIRHASDNLEAFLSDVLDLLLDVFDADRACLLYACDPDAPSWSVPMERTRPEWPGVFALGVDMPMQPGMAEEFRFMLAEQRAVPYGSPGARAVPANVAERFSIKSQINTLLRPIVGKPWEMGIHHCVEPRAYGEQDLFLFDAIAERITDVLGSLLSIKQLRESERHFRAYFERSMIGMAFIGLEKNWLETNDALCEMLGYEREELQEISYTALVCPDDLNAAEDQFNSLLHGGINGYAMDARLIHKSGGLIYAHLVVRAIGKDDGTLDYAVMLVEDITPRRQAENLRRHYEALSRLLEKQATNGLAVLDTIESAMVVVNIDCKVVFANSSARELMADARVIKMREGNLCFQPLEQQGILAMAIKRAIEEGADTETVLERAESKTKFWVTVLPLDTRLSSLLQQPMALVVLHEPHAPMPETNEFLRQGYGLSMAEIRLADALVKGDAPEEYANKFSIQISTVRTQLRSIFAKTGTKKQSDVVRLLAGAPRIRSKRLQSHE